MKVLHLTFACSRFFNLHGVPSESRDYIHDAKPQVRYLYLSRYGTYCLAFMRWTWGSTSLAEHLAVSEAKERWMWSMNKTNIVKSSRLCQCALQLLRERENIILTP